jgi:hypothetical protein
MRSDARKIIQKFNEIRGVHTKKPENLLIIPNTLPTTYEVYSLSYIIKQNEMTQILQKKPENPLRE